jgi:hypothetical protein
MLIDLGRIGNSDDCCTRGVFEVDCIISEFEVDRIMSSWKVRKCRVSLLVALELVLSTEVDAALVEAFGPLAF